MFPVLALAIFCGLLAQNTQGYASPQAIVNLGPEMLQRRKSMVCTRGSGGLFPDHAWRCCPLLH